MQDIAKAIERERVYLSYRMKGEEPFHLVDAVKECGFETLDGYFEAKQEYLITHLQYDVVETTPAQAIAEVLNAMTAKKTAVLFADTEYTLVWNGNGSEFNEDYCRACGIPILPLQTNGGTIVSTKGDLNIGICVPDEYVSDVRWFLNGFAKIFRKYTEQAVEVNGNDILVNGFKVLGSSSYRSNGMFTFITPVSLTEKRELIQSICVKHSDKIPAHIDFMDNATLRREVLEWLRAALS